MLIETARKEWVTMVTPSGIHLVKEQLRGMLDNEVLKIPEHGTTEPYRGLILRSASPYGTSLSIAVDLIPVWGHQRQPVTTVKVRVDITEVGASILDARTPTGWHPHNVSPFGGDMVKLMLILEDGKQVPFASGTLNEAGEVEIQVPRPGEYKLYYEFFS